MMAFTPDDLKALTEQLQDNLELRVALAEQILDEQVITRLMHQNERLRESFRRAVLTDELINLPREFREFREEVIQRFDQVDQRFDRVEQEVGELRQELRETRQDVKSLQDWRRGEEARRVGEEYERKMVRRAVRIFGVGESGSPKTHEHVYRQVVEWLVQGGVLDGDVPDEDDPLNADLIWWKGDYVVVAEISLKVDKYDVLRAKRRAEPLKQAGLKVLPVVIGAEWAHPETEQIANQEGVGWRVGNLVSDSLVAFRKASVSE
ncbi:MAG: hypothetical protein ACK4ME_02880 [Fimbriimonadales bacterium]